jgi:hypothetical protein
MRSGEGKCGSVEDLSDAILCWIDHPTMGVQVGVLTIKNTYLISITIEKCNPVIGPGYRNVADTVPAPS